MTNFRSDSPFVHGLKVGVNSHFSDDYRADEVLKVHKNGNFTLKSNPTQQYRPTSYRTASETDELVWTASPTGQSFSRTSVRPWDAHLEAMIARSNASRTRRLKLHRVKAAVAAIHERCDDDALIDALASLLKIA